MSQWIDFLNHCRWQPKLEESDHIGFDGVHAKSLAACQAKQIHGTVIIEADDNFNEMGKEADGLFTKKSGLPIAVRTADCLPVIVRGDNFAMALHCGWRGLVNGMLGQAHACILGQGLSMSGLEFSLGPCIQPEQFEVGPEVAVKLIHGRINLLPSQSALSLMKGRLSDRWHLDLQSAAALHLANLGVPARNIKIVRICTKEDKSFHSYRRDGQKAGRNLSWVKIP